jgi:hypothetical protein
MAARRAKSMMGRDQNVVSGSRRVSSAIYRRLDCAHGYNALF